MPTQLDPSQQAAAALMSRAVSSGFVPNPQQQMILDAFNSETYVANKIDVQHEPLFDTIAYSNGAAAAAGFYNATGYPVGWSGPANGATIQTSNSQFFVNVGSASNKTLGQCNISTSKKLDAPEAFAIFGFRVFINPTISLLDWANIVETYALQFWIGNKAYNTGPIDFYQAGGGLAGTTTQTGTQFVTNGLPGRNAMHKLAVPLVIENQASFYAQLVGNNYTLATAANGGQGVWIRLLLDGLHARGVQ